MSAGPGRGTGVDLIRIAAVGDTHVVEGVRGLRGGLADLAGEADILLLAGDLTNAGTRAEGDLLQEELRGVAVPMVAVLGNHDLDSGEGDSIAGLLRGIGVRVLDGDATVLEVRGVRVGIAGMKGTGGGFDTAVPMPDEVVESSSGIVESTRSVERLRSALEGLDTDVRIALTHYAPVPDTLRGEPPEIWEHLGSRLLGAAIDAGGARLAVHGHAHRGGERGVTPGGCPVRNVAQAVIRRPYATCTLSAAGVLLAG